MADFKVSVIMITYGHEKYIEEAIESVLMQECDFEVELIVANDCSPDGTDFVVNNIIQNHSKSSWIKYTKHPQNKGMIPNFTWAVKQCKGKYIAICEGDDYWTDPLKLQKQVDFLEDNSEYTFCVHRYKLYIDNKKEFEDDIYPINYGDYKETGKGIIIDEKMFLKDWFTQPLSAVIAKKDFEKVLNKQLYFKYFRDYHIFYFLLQSSKGFCLDSCSGVYRINDGGIASSKTFYEKIKTAFLIYEEIYLYTKDTGVLFNYWKFAFVMMRKKRGVGIILKSFVHNFEFKYKLVSIKFFLKVFFDSILTKLK